MRVEQAEKYVYDILQEAVLQDPFCSLEPGPVDIFAMMLKIGDDHYVEIDVLKQIPAPIDPSRNWATCGGYVPVDASDEVIRQKISDAISDLKKAWLEGSHAM